jgi:hypothetical protein
MEWRGRYQDTLGSSISTVFLADVLCRSGVMDGVMDQLEIDMAEPAQGPKGQKPEPGTSAWLYQPMLVYSRPNGWPTGNAIEGLKNNHTLAVTGPAKTGVR